MNGFSFADLWSTLSAVATAISAFLIFAQIRSSSRWSRLQASHSMLNALVSGVLEDTLETLSDDFDWDILHDRKTYTELAAELDEGDRKRLVQVDRHLRRMLRRLEAMCISMDSGIVSESVCKNYLFSLLTRVHEQAKGFIEIERSRRGEPRVFEHLEHYARKWSR